MIPGSRIMPFQGPILKMDQSLSLFLLKMQPEYYYEYPPGCFAPIERTMFYKCTERHIVQQETSQMQLRG